VPTAATSGLANTPTASAAAMSVRLVSRIDRSHSRRSASCRIRRAGRFGSTAMFLPLRSHTDWIEPSAAQPSPPVETSIVPMMMPWVSLRRPSP
jgi:hypothetical protein